MPEPTFPNARPLRLFYLLLPGQPEIFAYHAPDPAAAFAKLLLAAAIQVNVFEIALTAERPGRRVLCYRGVEAHVYDDLTRCTADRALFAAATSMPSVPADRLPLEPSADPS